MPSVSGVRAELDVDASHIFPQGTLATITLIGSVAGVGGTRGCTGSKARFPLYSVAVTALSGVGSALNLLEQNL